VLKEAGHDHPVAPLGRAEHVLGTVAVVHVEIDDRHPLEPADLERIGGGHRDVVEDAKAHGARRGGVVPAGPHRAERVVRPSRHHFLDRENAGARRAPRRVEARGIHGGVGIELHVALLRRVLEDQIDVRGPMHPLEILLIGERRLQAAKLRQNPAGAHVFVHRIEAFGIFRVAGAHFVAQAFRVGDVGCRHGGSSR
jgi:hypothetical protein